MSAKTMWQKSLSYIQQLKLVDQAKLIILFLVSLTFIAITGFTSLLLKKDIMQKHYETKQTIVNLQSYNAKEAFFKYGSTFVTEEWIQSNMEVAPKGEINIITDKKVNIYFCSSFKKISDVQIQDLANNVLQQEIDAPKFISFNNKLYMPVVSKKNEANLFVICLIPKNQIDSTVAPSLNVSILIGITLIMLSVLLISFLIKYFTRPLLFLTEKIKRFANGDFTVKANIKGCKEIENLSTEFNKMVCNINDFIQTNYTAKLAWKDAQFVALKSQINPRFFNNTLQTISAAAIENNQMNIYDMVVSLSSVLNYVIQEQDSVTLETEISHVTDYLIIQKHRFENRLTYSVEVDKKISLLLVPKICIMTLVENSIIHGLTTATKTLHIHIQASVLNGKLNIEVTDDGNGIPEDTLISLQKSLNDSSMNNVSKKSTGLKNLSDRLNFLYNNSAKISIYSTLYTGTTIIIEVDASKLTG